VNISTCRGGRRREVVAVGAAEVNRRRRRKRRRRTRDNPILGRAWKGSVLDPKEEREKKKP